MFEKKLWIGALCGSYSRAGGSVIQNSKVKIQKMEDEIETFELNE